MLIGIFSGWFLLSIVVGFVASNVGRDFGKYFLMSVFLSPLVAFAILAVKGKKTKDEVLDSTPHIFYCRTCNSAYGGVKEQHTACPDCGNIFTETTILRSDWRTYSDEKKTELKNCFMRGQFLRDSVNSATVTSVTGSASEIKHYKELLDAGIITQAEFDAKKKQLLGL